jgi:hypothetical protein
MSVMNEVVCITHKGEELYAGMIESTDVRGCWEYSFYWTDGGGMAYGKREAISIVRKEAREAIKDGSYFKGIPKEDKHG